MISVLSPPAAQPSSAVPAPELLLLTVTADAAPPGTTVIVVRGDVDMLSSMFLQDRLLPHLRAPGPGSPATASRVILDLTGVEFLAAAGLAVLVALRQAADAAGVGLCLVASTRAVLMPLTVTGLDGTFDIRSGLADALCRAGGRTD